MRPDDPTDTAESWEHLHQRIVDVPLSNIYRLHWSVNPTDARLVESLMRASYEDIPPVRGYIGYPAAYRDSYIKLTKQKLNPRFPRVYVHDGTHRATAAFMRWDEEKQRRPTLRVLLEHPRLPLGLAGVEWDADYGTVPTYAQHFERVRIPVRQIASPFFNPIKQERIDELAELEDEGYELPPIIVDGPGEVEESDYPEERYPFLDGHYPEVGEEVWFVHDGHHRTMLAIQRGQRFIDALLIER